MRARDWRLVRDGEDEVKETDRWLVTYADMVTLLLIFFVVMYALSAKISNSNFEKLAKSLQTTLKKKDIFAPPTVDIRQDLVEAKEKVKQAVTEFEGKSQVKVDLTSRGLVISLYDTAFFDAGSSEIKGEAREALMKIGQAIATMSNAVSVEGHSDNTRGKTSNWVLSAERAANVVEFLSTKGKVKANRFQVVSYAEYKPLFPNDTPEHRALNRRVDLVIQESAPKPALTPKPAGANDLLPPAYQSDYKAQPFNNPFGNGGIPNPFGNQ